MSSLSAKSMMITVIVRMDLMNQGPLHVIMLGFTVKMLDTDQCCSCPAELETEFVIVVMELTSGAQVSLAQTLVMNLAEPLVKLRKHVLRSFKKDLTRSKTWSTKLRVCLKVRRFSFKRKK